MGDAEPLFQFCKITIQIVSELCFVSSYRKAGALAGAYYALPGYVVKCLGMERFRSTNVSIEIFFFFFCSRTPINHILSVLPIPQLR